ncbi:MAG: FG-GAP repeat protein [Bdellovibrionales bacterium]|nr:FG-GAP repeat protein [Bdellovibrionales bacterium]
MKIKSHYHPLISTLALVASVFFFATSSFAIPGNTILSIRDDNHPNSAFGSKILAVAGSSPNAETKYVVGSHLGASNLGAIHTISESSVSRTTSASSSAITLSPVQGTSGFGHEIIDIGNGFIAIAGSQMNKIFFMHVDSAGPGAFAANANSYILDGSQTANGGFTAANQLGYTMKYFTAPNPTTPSASLHYIAAGAPQANKVAIYQIERNSVGAVYNATLIRLIEFQDLVTRQAANPANIGNAVQFGRALDVGDLDNDGWPDIVVGAPGLDVTNLSNYTQVQDAGGAFLYLDFLRSPSTCPTPPTSPFCDNPAVTDASSFQYYQPQATLLGSDSWIGSTVKIVDQFGTKAVLLGAPQLNSRNSANQPIQAAGDALVFTRNSSSVDPSPLNFNTNQLFDYEMSALPDTHRVINGYAGGEGKLEVRITSNGTDVEFDAFIGVPGPKAVVSATFAEKAASQTGPASFLPPQQRYVGLREHAGSSVNLIKNSSGSTDLAFSTNNLTSGVNYENSLYIVEGTQPGAGYYFADDRHACKWNNSVTTGPLGPFAATGLDANLKAPKVKIADSSLTLDPTEPAVLAVTIEKINPQLPAEPMLLFPTLDLVPQGYVSNPYVGNPPCNIPNSIGNLAFWGGFGIVGVAVDMGTHLYGEVPIFSNNWPVEFHSRLPAIPLYASVWAISMGPTNTYEQMSTGVVEFRVR